MNKLFMAIVAFFAATISAAAQDQTGVSMQIAESVHFDQLLLPGASTKPLLAYTPYAADRKVSFFFDKVTIGNIGNGSYSVLCDKGKVTGIFLKVTDTASCRELKSFVDAHFGSPDHEYTEKDKGVQVRHQYEFRMSDKKASLSIDRDREALLTIN